MDADLALHDTLMPCRAKFLSFLEPRFQDMCEQIPVIAGPAGDANAWVTSVNGGTNTGPRQLRRASFLDMSTRM
jgi:hypothetical protein